MFVLFVLLSIVAHCLRIVSGKFSDVYYHELHYNSFSYGIGFRSANRDEPELSERYVPAQESVLDEDLDRDPCEEDEDFFESRPNAEEMEQAIGKFLDGMPVVESNGYEQLHRHLARLPVPEKKIISAISHTEAVEGGLIKTLSEEELRRFTPSELLLYKIASEHRYVQVHTSMCPYISVYTSMYLYIPNTCAYIPLHTSIYSYISSTCAYIPVHTSIYCYVPICTSTY